ncbi:MAG: hypothetical protein HGB12_10750, partial [Bacteroidetes bacterium]|nr:hypothetical protein [Bacteroidota bacterium]
LQFFDSKFSNNIDPVKDAQKSVETLSKKHELYVVTGRPFSTKQKTVNWLEKYFPNKFSGVYFDNKKMYEDGTEKHKTKSEICMELDANILIDDLLRFTNKCHEQLQVILFNRPWNQGDIPSNVKRLNSWLEITNFISKNE